MKKLLSASATRWLSRRAGILTPALIVMLLSATNSTAQDQPTIAKDSVQVTAFTLSSYKGDFKIFSWVPQLKLRVNGPIASGSQIYAEFTVPGGTAWKFDCKTEETEKGRWWQLDECGGRNALGEDKGITYTGPVSFAIKVRNELMGGGDATLFTGKMKVAKVHSNETGPDYVNHFVYYVDQDWNLPIGYLFYDRDDVRGWNYPSLSFAFWARTEYNAPYEPHLFHNGKEVGKMMYEGEEVGKASCGTTEVEDNPTHITSPQGQFVWTRWKCSFASIHAWNKTGEKIESMFGPLYMLNENAGDYEIKILYKGHLVRSIKFAVDAEGKLVDNGIAKSNHLGNDRVIVPVQVMGDADGPWDKNAWKTDAFYGNPLTGFAPPP
ncbi:MAG: hypothetical protein QOH71_72 [Blastocatellia bacterium]|nr:hypothetical protein [Blastocatellia bacterium]